MPSNANKPLKRLSLLQSTPLDAVAPKPESTHHPDPSTSSSSKATRPSPLRIQTTPDANPVTIAVGPSTAPLANLQNFSSNSNTLDSPVIPRSAVSFIREKAARRQSSISYISSSDNFTFGTAHSRTTSSKSNSPPASASLVGTRADKCRSLVFDARTQAALRREFHRTDGEFGENARSNLATREGQPMTLVEKHADLLHFIAQKESKCLELRAQLATHEAELLELKRKWEKIVSRGFTPTATGGGSGSSGAHVGSRSSDSSCPKHTRENTTSAAPRRRVGRPASVIGSIGLRENGRFMSGLGELVQQEFDTESTSSASPSTSTSTSVRLSQSSMSSITSACDSDGAVDNSLTLTRNSETGVTRTMGIHSKSDEPLDGLRTIGRAAAKKSTSRLVDESVTGALSSTKPAPMASPVIPSDTSGLRRRRSAGHKSSISPLSRAEDPSTVSEEHPTSSTSSKSPHAPPSSLLGLTALASLAFPSSPSNNHSSQHQHASTTSQTPNSPLSSLTLPLPRRTVQTVQTVQKRASAFLADASTSFFSVLAGSQGFVASMGPMGVGAAPIPEGVILARERERERRAEILRSKGSLGALEAECSALKAHGPGLANVSIPPSSKSLLDEDDEMLESQIVMTPDRITAQGASGWATQAVDKKVDNTDDWSW